MEWAIELALEYGKPVAATMCMGPPGDGDGVDAGECAVRMAKAGAQLVGVNCLFDPYTTLETVKIMKDALNAANLKPHLMCQALGYMTHGADKHHYGWVSLPEFPYGKSYRQQTGRSHRLKLTFFFASNGSPWHKPLGCRCLR